MAALDAGNDDVALSQEPQSLLLGLPSSLLCTVAVHLATVADIHTLLRRTCRALRVPQADQDATVAAWLLHQHGVEKAVAKAALHGPPDSTDVGVLAALLRLCQQCDGETEHGVPPPYVLHRGVIDSPHSRVLQAAAPRQPAEALQQRQWRTLATACNVALRSVMRTPRAPAVVAHLLRLHGEAVSAAPDATSLLLWAAADGRASLVAHLLNSIPGLAQVPVEGATSGGSVTGYCGGSSASSEGPAACLAAPEWLPASYFETIASALRNASRVQGAPGSAAAGAAGAAAVRASVTLAEIACAASAGEGHAAVVQVLIDARCASPAALQQVQQQQQQQQHQGEQQGEQQQQQRLYPLTPALQRAAMCGHTDVARILLNAPVEPARADAAASKALVLAAGQGHLGMVRLLLEQPDHPAHADAQGSEAMYVAACEEHWDVVRLLQTQERHAAHVSEAVGRVLLHGANDHQRLSRMQQLTRSSHPAPVQRRPLLGMFSLAGPSAAAANGAIFKKKRQ